MAGQTASIRGETWPPFGSEDPSAKEWAGTLPPTQRDVTIHPPAARAGPTSLPAVQEPEPSPKTTAEIGALVVAIDTARADVDAIVRRLHQQLDAGDFVPGDPEHHDLILLEHSVLVVMDRMRATVDAIDGSAAAAGAVEEQWHILRRLASQISPSTAINIAHLGVQIARFFVL